MKILRKIGLIACLAFFMFAFAACGSGLTKAQYVEALTAANEVLIHGVPKLSDRSNTLASDEDYLDIGLDTLFLKDSVVNLLTTFLSSLEKDIVNIQKGAYGIKIEIKAGDLVGLIPGLSEEEIADSLGFNDGMAFVFEIGNDNGVIFGKTAFLNGHPSYTSILASGFKIKYNFETKLLDSFKFDIIIEDTEIQNSLIVSSIKFDMIDSKIKVLNPEFSGIESIKSEIETDLKKNIAKAKLKTISVKEILNKFEDI